MPKKILQTSFIILTLLAFRPQKLVSQIIYNDSPALETILQQIDENYVPSDWNDTMNNMEKLSKTIPQIYFTFLGAAMNKQKNYINNNPIASQNFGNLNREVLFLIPDIVDFKNSLISNNNERISDNLLGTIYNDALVGIINETFKQEYKKSTGKDLSQIGMPSVLDQQTVGGTSFRKVAKKDKNEINLFGEVAPAATLDPGKKKPDVSNLPYSIGQCQKQSNEESFYVETGTSCTYNNGMLVYETQMVNYKKHGVKKYYEVRSGRHYMAESTPYTNDEKDGVEERYRYDDKTGRIYLIRRSPYKSGLIDGTVERYKIDEGNYYMMDSTPYVNGKEHGIKKTYGSIRYNSGPRKHYLKWETRYALGKRVEMIQYDDDGVIEARVRYDSDGNRIVN